MKIFKTTCLPLVLLYVLFSSPIVNASPASDVVQKLCDQLGTVAACKTSIRIPTPSVRYGTITLFRINSCKTKKKAFGISICIPGTEPQQVRTITGLDMVSTSVDICKFATKTIPGLPDLVKKSTAVCKCIPEVSLRSLSSSTYKRFTDSLEARTELMAYFRLGR